MPIHRPKNFPRMFFPDTAKEHGMVVAVIECAIMELCRCQDKITREEINVLVPIDALLKNCYFLDRYEALDAVFYLKKIKHIDIHDNGYICLRQWDPKSIEMCEKET